MISQEKIKKDKDNGKLILQDYIYLCDVFLFIFLPIGWKIGECFHYTVCIFISIVIRIISVGMIIIFFYLENNIMITISLILFNIGNTISCLRSLQNSCKFYMKNFGLVYALYLSVASFGSLMFTGLRKLIIKNNDNLIVNDMYLYVTGAITLLFSFCEMFFSTMYKEKHDLKIVKSSNSKSSLIDNNDENSNISESLDEMASDYNLSREKSYSSLILFKINIKKVLFSKLNLQLVYFYICDFCKYINNYI